jgi:hypothetical protein
MTCSRLYIENFAMASSEISPSLCCSMFIKEIHPSLEIQPTRRSERPTVSVLMQLLVEGK